MRGSIHIRTHFCGDSLWYTSSWNTRTKHTLLLHTTMYQHDDCGESGEEVDPALTEMHFLTLRGATCLKVAIAS